MQVVSERDHGGICMTLENRSDGIDARLERDVSGIPEVVFVKVDCRIASSGFGNLIHE